MIEFSPKAALQVRRLVKHYTAKGRPGAIHHLQAALTEASQDISSRPDSGIAAPRPYPTLAQPGVAWFKAGRYWIAFNTQGEPVIQAVFHETADIPNRIAASTDR